MGFSDMPEDITYRLRHGTSTADRTEAADLIDQLRSQINTQDAQSKLDALEDQIEEAIKQAKTSDAP